MCAQGFEGNLFQELNGHKPAPPPLIDVLPQEKARFSGFFLYKIASP